MAESQRVAAGGLFGWMPNGSVAAGAMLTQALNSASTLLAFSFVPSVSKTLAKVEVYTDSIVGSPIAANDTCYLYSSANGLPSGLLETKVNDATPATGFQQYSGFTTALTAGTQYWLLIKNLNASPATNYFIKRFGGPTSMQSFTSYMTTTGGWGWGKLHTTNGGTTWLSPVANCMGIRVEYSDGTFEGLISSAVNNVTGANMVFANGELGVAFITPPYTRLAVRGVAFPAVKVGAPTGSLRYRLYNDTVLLGTTTSIPTGAVQTTLAGATDGLAAYFASTIIIEPGTLLRVMMSETTQSDTSTNAYTAPAYFVEDTTQTRNLLPFTSGGMALRRTNTADATATPPVFVDVAARVIPFALLLDTDAEFAITRRLIHSPGMSGGMNA